MGRKKIPELERWLDEYCDDRFIEQNSDTYEDYGSEYDVEDLVDMYDREID